MKQLQSQAEIRMSQPKIRQLSSKRRPLDLTPKEVPLQVMVSGTVRKQVAMMCAERGENLRTVILRGLQAVGVKVPESELVDRRGRRRKS